MKGRCLMQKIITVKCPKCNNNHNFHKFGKDKFGNQKYRCLVCKHQFAPDFNPKTRMKNILLAPCAGNHPFCITIIVITRTLAVLIKSAITRFLHPSRQLLCHPLFLPCLVKQTLSVYAIFHHHCFVSVLYR